MRKEFRICAFFRFDRLKVTKYCMICTENRRGKTEENRRKNKVGKNGLTRGEGGDIFPDNTGKETER